MELRLWGPRALQLVGTLTTSSGRTIWFRNIVPSAFFVFLLHRVFRTEDI